jgi:hypothetical protein
VDSRFSFLSNSQAELLTAVLSRRNTELYERLALCPSVSQTDAEKIISTLGDELTDNLDADWEPTDYGREVSSLLAEFNRARVSEWP